MQPKTTEELIRGLLLDDVPSGNGKVIALGVVDYMLDLMTSTQKREILKKIKRCQFYCDSMGKGMEEVRIRSIIMRKEELPKQYIQKACEPCQKIWRGVKEGTNKQNVK